MAAPIFNPSKPTKSPESLAQEEVRNILRDYRKGKILTIAADTHPGIFAHALIKVQEGKGENLIFRGVGSFHGPQQPKVYLVECKDPNLKVRDLRVKDKFPAHGEPLERYLFNVIGEAFVAIGFLVEKGLPDRYHRGWVI